MPSAERFILGSAKVHHEPHVKRAHKDPVINPQIPNNSPIWVIDSALRSVDKSGLFKYLMLYTRPAAKQTAMVNHMGTCRKRLRDVSSKIGISGTGMRNPATSTTVIQTATTYFHGFKLIKFQNIDLPTSCAAQIRHNIRNLFGKT